MTVIFKRQTPERTKLLRKAFKAHNVAQKFLVHLYKPLLLARIKLRGIAETITKALILNTVLAEGESRNAPVRRKLTRGLKCPAEQSHAFKELFPAARRR